MGRAPYSTAEWGVEGFCELLAKAPSTGTGRAVPFQCITISQKVLRSREPQSAHLWTYSVPPSLNRLYGPSHRPFWCWLSGTYAAPMVGPSPRPKRTTPGHHLDETMVTI